MVYKIIWKDFKKELKNYLPLLISITLSVIVINVVFYANITGIKLVRSGLLNFYDIKMMLLSLPAVIILAWSMITYAMNHYIGSRSKSYQLFQILGIQMAMMKRMLFFEYCCGAVFAILTGMMISAGSLWGINALVQRMLGNDILRISWNNTILISFIVSLVVCFGIILLKYLSISKLNLAGLTTQKSFFSNKIAEKIKYICFWSGVLITGMSIWLLSNFFIEYGLIHQAGVLFFLVGLVVVFLFGMEICMIILKRNQVYYYSKLIFLSNISNQIRKNRKLLTSMFLINVLLFTTLFYRLLFNIPFSDESRDPFDIIWMEGQSAEKEIKETERLYNAETVNIAYAPMAIQTMEGSEPFVGISQSQYKSLGGKKVGLKEEDVLFVAQSGSKFLFSDNVVLNFLDKFEYETHRSKERTFHINGWEYTMLIGGNFNIAVLSDQTFQEMSAEIGGEKVWMAQNVPRTKQMAAEQNAIEKKGRANIWASKGVYGKEFERQIDLTQKMIMAILLGVVCVSLMLFSLYFVGVRLWSRIPEWKGQDKFLECQGMRYRERKQCVIKEIHFLMFLPYIAAVLAWSIYAFMDCLYMGEMVDDIAWAIRNWKYIGVMILLWGAVQVLYYVYLRRFISKVIWDRQRGE